jgi:hypothetical protein
MSKNTPCGYDLVKELLTYEMGNLTYVEVPPVVEEDLNQLNEALTSTWTLTGASLILLSGQMGFTLLELSQTQKKNRDFIVWKNLMVFIMSFMVWFVAGYAIAFGTDRKSLIPNFGGGKHGWFGDFNGGLSTTGDGSVT